MTLAEALRQAAQIVDDAGLSDEFREAGFRCVAQRLVSDSDLTGFAPGPSPGRPDGQTPLSQAAARLGLSPEDLSHVFFIEGDRLELVVSPSKLDPLRSRATEQIALLVAAGRQASGLDPDWTRTNVIREWSEHYKRLDAGNFAATIRGMDNTFSFRGTGRDRSVRMTAPAWQKATALVGELVGGEGN